MSKPTTIVTIQVQPDANELKLGVISGLQEHPISEKDSQLCSNLLSEVELLTTVALFKTTHPKLEDCIIGLKIGQIVREGSVELIEIEHWNYHPGRKDLQRTHLSTFKKGESPTLLKLVTGTFESLLRLQT